MAKLNQLRGRPVYVDFVRTVAMIGVILLHASGRWVITGQELIQLNHFEFTNWAVVDVYQTLGVIGVPLFSMLTGALLLQPESKSLLAPSLRSAGSASVCLHYFGARHILPGIFWCKISNFLLEPSCRAY